MRVPSKNAVILGIVVLTVAYHSWNLFGKKKPRGGTASPVAATAPASAALAAGPAAPASGTGTNAPASNVPDRPIDEAVILTQLRSWTESPRRDPFEALLATKVVKDERPPASALLTLQALWRQTGGHLAIINDRVLAVGESVAGFEIEQIEDANVWVRSPRGRERIELRAPNLNSLANLPGETATTNLAPRSKAPRSPAAPRERRFSP